MITIKINQAVDILLVVLVDHRLQITKMTMSQVQANMMLKMESTKQKTAHLLQSLVLHKDKIT